MSDLAALTILIAVAAFRLWRLASYDLIAQPIRKRMLYNRARLADFVDCPWCLGFWLTGAVTLSVDACMSVPLPVLVWLAASGIVGVVGDRA